MTHFKIPQQLHSMITEFIKSVNAPIGSQQSQFGSNIINALMNPTVCVPLKENVPLKEKLPATPEKKQKGDK